METYLVFRTDKTIKVYSVVAEDMRLAQETVENENAQSICEDKSVYYKVGPITQYAEGSLVDY